MRGISRHFGGVTALDDVDLDVSSGKVLAIVGDDGAGKSTPIGIPIGVHRPGAGSMTLQGALSPRRVTSPRRWRPRIPHRSPRAGR